MHRWFWLFGLGLGLGFAAVVGSASSAQAATASCQIGKPSYCLKYGQERCEATNRKKGKKAACARWTDACIECHAAVPKCLGNVRPAATTPVCKTCSTRWHACMQRIDKLYWPNRS